MQFRTASMSAMFAITKHGVCVGVIELCFVNFIMADMEAALARKNLSSSTIESPQLPAIYQDQQFDDVCKCDLETSKDEVTHMHIEHLI